RARRALAASPYPGMAIAARSAAVLRQHGRASIRGGAIDMAVTVEHAYPRPIHPLHAIFLGGSVALYLGAALSDIAYAASYEIQWNNFASWLNAGGLAFGAVALLCALLGLARRGRH